MSKQIAFSFEDNYQRHSGQNISRISNSHYHTDGKFLEPISQAPANSGVIRPIHYLGSKLRLVNLICEAVDQIDPSGGPVCDLFAGSGTVSRALSERRSVISVDIQEYSRVLCAALLHPPTVDLQALNLFWQNVHSSDHAGRLLKAVEPLAVYESICLKEAESGNLEPLCDLLEHGSLIALEQNACQAIYPELRSVLEEASLRLGKAKLADGPGALITRYYGGIYFSYTQAAQIDLLLESIESLPASQKNAFLAAVLSTASEVVNTIGKQFAQPLRPRTPDGKPKKKLYSLVTRDRSIDILKLYQSWLKRYLSIPVSEQPHKVIRQDYAEALDTLMGAVSVVYADPPYTRDHYSRFYHVLETICLRDNPPVSTVRIAGEQRISRGFYRTERHQSPFCIKSKAPEAFSLLFEKTRKLGVPLVLSYSPYEKDSGARPRLMTIDEISEIAKKYFRQVAVLRAGNIAHNKLNHAEKNVRMSYDAEVLVLCKP